MRDDTTGTRTALVAGASGLLGQALVEALRARGDEVVRLVRRREQAGQGAVFWDPAAGEVDVEPLAPVDVVICLSGENVGSGRWTKAKKERLWSSRTDTAGLLARAMAAGELRPRVFVCASAIGYYGQRGDQPVAERDARGEGFLAELCEAWEAACAPAREAGVRVVNARFGIVLSPAGGALPPMVMPFKLGVGGPLGDGQQYFSWISLDDAVAAVLWAVDHPEIDGPLNVVAPQPVTNTELTRVLGRVLGRPTRIRVPGFALRLALGEFANEALGSLRVLPDKLTAAGFAFRDPALEPTLRRLLLDQS